LFRHQHLIVSPGTHGKASYVCARVVSKRPRTGPREDMKVTFALLKCATNLLNTEEAVSTRVA